jgi:mono/diheme cytochrome c family protein
MHHLKLCGVIIALLLSSPILADNQQAKVNYMLHCQGCHTPDGSGLIERGIPSLKDFMGKFLMVPGGREFLIQVPGASQALMTSQELAEMTNWMLQEFDPRSIGKGFNPYTASEVETLRQTKLIEVVRIRAELVSKIEKREDQ